MTIYPGQYVKCIHKNNNFEFIYHNNYESRGMSVEKMIRDAANTHNIVKDFSFIVNTGDIPEGNSDQFPIYHFCNKQEYSYLFPDFMYDGWPEIKMPNYTNLINEIIKYDLPPMSNKAGWIGVINQHHTRHLLYKHSKINDNIECIPIQWAHDGNTLNAVNYMSYFDHMSKWKYMIDVEGCGWSARLKVFLTMPRITFIVDRPYKDWCFEFLEPWKHYIPVKRDLSDFQENYNKIESDYDLQRYIIEEKSKLYDQCLSYSAALNQINYLISRI
jgi:hypothetical protein